MDRRSFFIAGLLILAASLPSNSQTPPLVGPLPRPTVNQKILPWIEVNAPEMPLKEAYPFLGDETRRYPLVQDYAVAALRAWSTVTDTFAVSSRIESVDATYRHLMRHKPSDMRIIGGLKTFNLPGCTPGDRRPYDFADPQGWSQIAAASRKIVQITGVPTIILENETTLIPFHEGKATIDLAKLKESLAVLRNSDIEFWWNLPIILHAAPGFPDREQRTTELIAAIAEAMPNAVFLTQFTMWREWETIPPGEPERRKRMRELVGPERFMERLLVTTDGYWNNPNARGWHPRRTYKPAEALDEMRKLYGDIICMYPDSKSWILVGEELGRLRPRSTKGQ